ncbi:MAG TPA: DUF4288 domain-containing protein [Flavisolibacter sp.]
MDWYLVKIVYRIICGEGKHIPQFDEQVRIVMAENCSEALEKGRMIGRQEEETFYNNREQLVQWKFINVTELHPLTELTDGAEVFSQIKEIDHAEDYCNFTHHKHARLNEHVTSITFQTA